MGAGSNADAIRAALTQPGNLNSNANSNAILDDDPVSAFLQMMSPDSHYGTPYGLIYRKWRNHPAAKNGWDQEVWGTTEDTQLVAELHDAEFWRVSGSAERLAALAGAADAMKTGVTGMRARLQDAWQGKAADAATGQFDALAKAVQSFHDTLSTVSTNLSSAADACWPSVDSLGWNADGTSAFSKSGPELMTIADPSTQVDRINYRLYTEHSYTIEQLKQPGTCDLNEGAGMLSDTWWSDETIRGLDKMCGEYNAAVRWFRERLRSVHKTVKDAWTQLNQQLTGLRDTGDVDPFGKLAMSTGDQGGHDTGPGTHSRPPDPKGTTDPSQVPGVVDPGQTTPNQTSPGADQPVPGSSSTGAETVTIKDGNRTITVESPDGQGHVHVSVDDGTGHPKDYDLDFHGVDHSGADQGSFNGDLSGQQDHGGQVVIHDGDTTITAERDGGDGGMSLTVDDGTGHPTHYDVDFDDPNQSGTDQPGADQSGTDQSGTSSDPSTNPSPATHHADTSADTSASASGGGSGSGGGGYSHGGTAGDGSAGASPGTSGQDSAPQPGSLTGASPQSGDGSAHQGLAPAASAGPASGGGGMGGGMPMMGGMGGGHGAGGDNERTPSQWRTEGNLFTDPDPAERFDGVIGDDAPHLK